MKQQKLMNLRDKKYDSVDLPVTLEKSVNYLVVRLNEPLAGSENDYFSPFGVEVVHRRHDVNVYVLRAVDENNAGNIKNKLRMESTFSFVGNAFLIDGEPVIYTGNLIIVFDDDKNENECRNFLSRHELREKQQLRDVGNVWLVSPVRDIGSLVIDLSHQILDEPDIEASYPEIIQFKSGKGIHANQWHLKTTQITYQATIKASANVEKAHEITRGDGVIVAIIDDGVDITHPEFSSPGKVVYPVCYEGKEVSLNPVPKRKEETHGTACAGVAVASGKFGATGVAPAAKLMPIRLEAGIGSFNEALAFMWATRNGADVISCSWGPKDGDPLDPDDPLHDQKVKIAPHTRRAIEYAVKNGRKGKGCAIFFASGNGNESVDNDGYASHPKVIAVAACNSAGEKSYYSDYGNAIFCAFPSNDILASSTPGIWTTIVTHKEGDIDVNAGDPYGNYTNLFGGTSSACAGAAGIAALVLSVRPDLKLNELKDILKKTCDKIESEKGTHEKSEYAKTGHSVSYGFGRLNAANAVQLALKGKSAAAPILLNHHV